MKIACYNSCELSETEMTKTISIGEINNSVRMLLALTKNGDEIVLEESGKPLAKIIPFENLELNREFSDWETASDQDFFDFENKLA